MTGKRNATIEFCQVRHVVHKHKLTMTRILRKVSGLFEFIDCCLAGMLANIHEYFNCCHIFYFLQSNLSKILHVAFLLLVSIHVAWSIPIDPKHSIIKGLRCTH